MSYRQNRVVVPERDIEDSIRRSIRGTPYNTVTTVTASAVAADYNVILCDCTGGAITITLPRAQDYNGSYTVKKIDSSANAVTIDCVGLETLDGSGSISWTAQYDARTVVSDNSNWWIV